jgi:copper transport protein
MDRKNGSIDPVNPSILKAGLKRNLLKGTYRIQWKVISDDGHPVQGVIPFQIGAKSEHGGQSLKTKTINYMPQADLVIIRWLQYVSNACYVGLLFFYLMVLPKELSPIVIKDKSLSRLIWSGFFVLCLSIILSLPLQATIVLGIKWSEVFSVDALKQILAYTEFGKMWYVQAALLFILAIATRLWRINKALAWVCLILGIGLLGTRSFISHAASQEHSFLAILFDFLHLLSASVWVGSLFGLVVLLRFWKSPDTRRYYYKTIRTFSRWGTFLVLLLAATGVYNALQYIPTVSSLFHTDYGRALLCKILLFFIMLIFAAFNFRKGKAGKESGKFTSIWGELTFGLLILLVTVFLTNFPTAMSSPGPFNETNVLGNGEKITFEVTPNVIGENEFLVKLKNAKNKAITNIEQVTLTFTHLEMDMGKDTITLTKVSAGMYEAKGMNFNMSGKWKVHAHILTKSLDSIDTEFRCIVGTSG